MYGRDKLGKHGSTRRVTRNTWILLLGFLLGLWVPALSYMAWRSWRDAQPDVLPQVDLGSGHNFVYDLRQLDPDKAIWFTYPVGPERIRFVLHKDSSSKVRAAVASCTACYPFKNGNQWKKGRVMCARCRMGMRVGDPNEKLTPAKGCVAVPVPFFVDNGLLTVRAKDIEAVVRDLQSAQGSTE